MSSSGLPGGPQSQAYELQEKPFSTGMSTAREMKAGQQGTEGLHDGSGDDFSDDVDMLQSTRNDISDMQRLGRAQEMRRNFRGSVSNSLPVACVASSLTKPACPC